LKTLATCAGFLSTCRKIYYVGDPHLSRKRRSRRRRRRGGGGEKEEG
jgi:hypothetical protein